MSITEKKFVAPLAQGFYDDFKPIFPINGEISLQYDWNTVKLEIFLDTPVIFFNAKKNFPKFSSSTEIMWIVMFTTRF